MVRINSSRQAIAASQRNVNIARYYAKHPPVGPAPFIRRETFYDENADRSVLECIADQPILKGAVFVNEGDHYYRVESPKFPHFYYLVTLDYQCSSSEIANYCIDAVRAYQQREAQLPLGA